jgi:hypothetical protein
VWEEALGTDGKPLNDNNNGIDSMSGGDWIRLQWEKVSDNVGVSRIDIYRFSDMMEIQDTDPVGTVSGTVVEFPDFMIGVDPRVGVEWQYFIIAYDHAGNYAVSDTVSFMLTEKPILDTPEAGVRLNNDSLRSTLFSWNYASGAAADFRFLVFEEDDDGEVGRLVWSKDLLSNTEHMTMYEGIDLERGRRYWWRVDTKGWPIDEFGTIRSGSKSVMRSFEMGM